MWGTVQVGAIESNVYIAHRYENASVRAEREYNSVMPVTPNPGIQHPLLAFKVTQTYVCSHTSVHTLIKQMLFKKKKENIHSFVCSPKTSIF